MSDDHQLPDGWNIKPLGEVATTQLGKAVKPKERGLSPQLPYLRNANVQWDEVRVDDVATMHFNVADAARYELSDGDLLVCEGGIVGRSAIWRGQVKPCYFQNALHRVRPRDDAVTTEWLLENLRLLVNNGEVASRARGNTILHLSQDSLRSLPVVVPPREVTDVLLATLSATKEKGEHAQERLAAARRAIERFRQAVLAAACSGRLTADWRDDRELERAEAAVERRRESERRRLGGKYRDPFTPDIDKLPEIPTGWTWATLPELGDLGRGRSKHRPRNDPKLYGGTYPFIQTGDVARSRGRITSHSQTYNEAGLAQSRLWPERTVCITIAANIADSGLLMYPACFPDSVVGLIADESFVLPEYVELFIRTARRDLAMFAPATAQANINLAILSELAVAVPPLEEQRELIDRTHGLFDSADSILARVDAASSRVDRSSQAVLAKAFRGELIPNGAVAR